MIYHRLTLQDFGVYRGQQEFEFSRERGVWIIYGQNSRGKTTLLNAFRYALYGEYLGRTSQRPLEEVVNELHAKEMADSGGEPSFAVTLSFSHDGSDYELTRTFRSGMSYLQLLKDGSMLSADASERELRAVAPPSISRFFLFDGELLKQYEELSDEGSDAARQLRDEVNRILGVTSILRTVDDLKDIHANETKQLAKAAAAQDKSQRDGNLLAQVQSKRDALSEEKTQTETELASQQARLDEVEEHLSAHTQSREIMGRLEQAKGQRTQARMDLDAAIGQLKEVTPGVWKAVLKADLGVRVQEMEERRSRVDDRRIEAYANHFAVNQLQSSEECPTCKQPLDEHTHATALRLAQASSDDGLLEALDAEVDKIRSSESLLRRLGDEAETGRIADREKAVADLRLKLSGLDAEIKELEGELAGVDETEVARLQKERDDLVQLIQRDRDHLDAVVRDIAEMDRQAAEVRRRISASGVTIEPEVEQRERLSGELVEMFTDVVDSYQTSVLADVESEATQLFTRMRSEEDFAGLRISEGYGVQIMDRGGEVVRGHSAGYAHLIALALIGALQRCSPVQGPIIMDSPFGRLDAEHTRQVVAALPEVADQVVLLAFESEFDREAARDELGPTLVAEHVLARGRAAKETYIEPREDA